MPRIPTVLWLFILSPGTTTSVLAAPWPAAAVARPEIGATLPERQIGQPLSRGTNSGSGLICVLTRRERDTNNDGNVDNVTEFFYDPGGNRIRQEFDNNNDGNVNAVSEFFYDPSGNLTRQEGDFNNDGNVDDVTENFISCLPSVEIPALAPTGLLVLIGLFAILGVAALSRRSLL